MSERPSGDKGVVLNGSTEGNRIAYNFAYCTAPMESRVP
jgi:hypothetical protein